MKKIFSLALVLMIGATVSFAQTSTSTDKKEDVNVAAPAIKAVDAAKCSSGTGSCCKGAGKAEAVTGQTPATETATEANAPVEATTGVNAPEAAPSCHSTSFSVSAAKPEPATTPEEDSEKK